MKTIDELVKSHKDISEEIRVYQATKEKLEQEIKQELIRSGDVEFLKIDFSMINKIFR